MTPIPRPRSVQAEDRVLIRNLSEDRVSSNSFSPPTSSVSRQSPLLRRRPVITASPQIPTRKSLTSPPPSVSSPSPLPPSPVLDPEPCSQTLSKKIQRRRSHDSGSFQIFSDTPSGEDIPGILKNPLETAQTVPLSLSDPKTPTKSILKLDTNVRTKTEDSFDVAEAVSSSSSTEDLARSFTDVIIDPLPGHGRRSAPEVRNKL